MSKEEKDKSKEQQEQKSANNNQGALYTTVEDLKKYYPKLVAEIEAGVVADINKASVSQAKKHLPTLFDRIATASAGIINKMPSGPGFLLELDDPFADGALRAFMNYKSLSGLRLPYVLPYDDKSKTAVDEKSLERQYNKSEALQQQFKSITAYIQFESLVVVRSIRNYILRAEGSGDTERASAAKAALKKIK